ncbi:VOC family protein [Sphingomonas sp. GlSt437]|uniref:VOC family protein n=1 Tax=Sphingomonas sp. GlSt437 TaxID=3389970 RepID=UPI003A8C632D
MVEAHLTGLVPLVQVYDMPRAFAFYGGVLGFAVLAQSPEVETREGRFSHWMWLRRESVDVMLNTAYDSSERPEAIDAQRWAGHADTCLFLGCSDVDAIHAELTERGLAAAPVHDTPHGMRQFSVSDPDGYELCFQQRR